MFTIGGLRFRLITGRWTPEHEEARRRHAGAFLVDDRYSIADTAVFACAHVAEEAGIDTTGYPSFRAWLERVRAQPGFVDDLEPYPPNASVLAGTSIYG